MNTRVVGLIRSVDNNRGPHQANFVGVLALEAAWTKFGYLDTGDLDAGGREKPTTILHSLRKPFINNGVPWAPHSTHHAAC